MTLLILLLACNPEPKDEDDTGTTHLGGDGGGTDGMPSGGCIEVARTPVTDSSKPVGTLPFAADEALAVAVGAFHGTATLKDATGADVTVPADWGVDVPTELVAVDMEVDTATGGTDTGPAMGAPEAEPAACPDYSAGSVTGTLSTAPDDESLWLYEVWSGELALWSPTRASTGFTKDITALGGNYQPDFDPAEYDTAVLDLWAETTKTGWHGELQWSASRDLGGGMGEGVVGPAGSFDVARTE